MCFATLFGSSMRTPADPNAAPAGNAVPPTPTLMTVECPLGASEGTMITVDTPSGRLQVEVPPGIREGMEFQFQLPVPEQVVPVEQAVHPNATHGGNTEWVPQPPPEPAPDAHRPAQRPAQRPVVRIV